MSVNQSQSTIKNGLLPLRMKKSTAVLNVFLFGAALLAVHTFIPIGFSVNWEGTLHILWSLMCIFAPICGVGYFGARLVEALQAAGRPIMASALEPEVLYIVESAIVERGAGTYIASLAVLKKAVLADGETDRQTNRLLVFFPGKELREGGRVMGVTTKWFEAFSKTGATSETTLVLVGSQA